MKLPPNCQSTLEGLVSQLYALLPKEARPATTNALIAEAEISKDEEVQRVQRFYNMAWLVLNNVLPGIAPIHSEAELKAYLFRKQIPILEQWLHIFLDRIQRAMPEKNISDEQQAKDIHGLSMQIAHDAFNVHVNQILPNQRQCKSEEEAFYKYFNHIHLMRSQLKLPILTYLCNFISGTDSPSKLGEIIPNEKLSKDLKAQLFQSLYNIICSQGRVLPYLNRNKSTSRRINP